MAGEDWTFTTREITVRELIMLQRVIQRDFTAMVDILVARTEPPRSQDDVLNLTFSEMEVTLERFWTSLNEARNTSQLLRQFRKEQKLEK